MSIAEFLWAIVAAGGGGAMVSLAVARVFGEKWLDSKFAGRLQSLRHEHEKQLEIIRLDTARALDRAARLSEREFECSADAWSLIFESYARTMGAMPGFRQHDDFSKLSDDLARIVADKNSFEDWETAELLAREKALRNSYFNDRKRAHELRDAKIAVRDASHFLDRKALFLDKQFYGLCKAFADFAWKAIITREIIMEMGPGELDGIRRDDEDFRANAEAKIKAIEQHVRRRFWQENPVEAES